MNSATPLISEYLIDMFEANGIRTEQSNGVLQFPQHRGIKIWGEAFQSKNPDFIQLDVLMELPDKKVLCESYSGMRTDSSRQTVVDALSAYFIGALHVVLSACFTHPRDFDTTSDRWSDKYRPRAIYVSPPPLGFGFEFNFGTRRDCWTINGVPRQIYLGPVTSRYATPGGLRDDNPLPGQIVDWIHDRLRRSSLPPGYHWMRIYHCHNEGQAMANEVLLDNEIWPEAQDELARFPWPVEPDPNDARMFLMIRDANTASRS